MVKFSNYTDYLKESLKMDGVVYRAVKNADGENVYVSNIGFLGKDDHIIDWDTINTEYKKFYNEIKNI